MKSPAGAREQQALQRRIFDGQITSDIGPLGAVGTSRPANWVLSYLDRIARALDGTLCREDSRLLDIGCGAFGYVPIHAVRRGAAVSCGIELSLKACRYAAAFSMKTAGKPLPYFLQCSADSICFRKDTFDAVTCIALLEHVVDDDAVINEAYRVLRENGVFYLVVPNDYRMIPFFLRFYYRRVDRKMGHLRHYGRETLSARLRTAGFSEISFHTTGHLVKMFQYLLTLFMPWLDSPRSRLWWLLERMDIRQPDNDRGVTLTAVARKT